MNQHHLSLTASIVYLLLPCFSQEVGEEKNILENAKKAARRVAIVGGGIGGATAAYYLREELGDDVEIVLFEESGRIGGRLKTVKVGERYYEAGGSVIHPRNQHMADLTRKLNLSRRQDGPDFTFGLYTGQSVVFQTVNIPYIGSIWNKVKLLWRYGLDLFRLNPWVNGVLDWYSNIYSYQGQKQTFTTVHEMFHSLSPMFDDLMTTSIKDYLTQLGFSDTFIHELARIAMKTNYGQDVDIQGFVGAVSLAEAQVGLWAVEGGNFRVAESAFEASKAVFKAARVTSIDEAASGRGKHFHVTYSLKEELDDFLSPLLSSHTEDFDAVVLAIPCTSKDCGDLELKVWRVEEKFQHFPDAYQRTVAVFVKGYVDHSQFGVGSSQDFPDCLFSITNGLIFNSLCRQVPVDFKPAKNDSLLPSDFNVWKIFCPAPWTVHHVNRFFVNHSDFVVQDWLAYPKYTKLSSALPPFVLDEHGGLVSINAVEAAASAMEQSVIGAKNAALLIKKFLEK